MRQCVLICLVLLVMALATGCEDEPRPTATPLHRAVRAGDVRKVRACLADGPNIDARDRNGRTPLHYAVRYGEEDVAELLVEQGVNVNAIDGDGETPLHMAAFRGQVDLVELLLAHGAKIDVADKAGYTPLHVGAGGHHDTDFVEVFLTHGANINAADKKGQTPVAHAARCGNFGVVQSLLAGGAKPPSQTSRAGAGGSDAANAMIAVAQPDVQTLVESNSAFAINLYRQLRSREGNLFFSPYSISAALAMTYAGARGETEKQMAEVLHFSLDQGTLHPAFAGLRRWLNQLQQAGNVTLYTANSLWPQSKYPFLREYLGLMQEYYDVSITPVDYEHAPEAARQQINRWAQSRTRGKITDLVPPDLLDPLTVLVLVNAIYFKGKWGDEFDPDQTRPSRFHVSPEQTVTVPMMHQTTKAQYAEFEGLQALALPYRGETLSMLVLLPKETDGITDLEGDLSVDMLSSWRESLRQTKVRIYLPRFRMTHQFCLRKTLAAMGMIDAFVLGKADFTGMDGGHDSLYIKDVVHKAFIEVNEEGTEAAAATAVAVARRARFEPPTFRADHPFLFLIQENRTGTILFIGRVIDPTRTD